MAQEVLTPLSLICTHGDIKLKIPELSKVLKDSITDTKLAGTRLIYEYYFFLGVFHAKMYEDSTYKIRYWISYIYGNYDPVIEDYGARFMQTKLSEVLTDQLTHAVSTEKVQASCQILTYYKAPWNNGFIFNTEGLTNYRGFIEPEPTIDEDEILYG